jgi:isopentenyldiphosphate isomerase
MTRKKRVGQRIAPRNLDSQARRRLSEAVAQNPDELFDVVDDQDRVIGRIARREVHAHGLRHRAVHVLVVNGAGEVFLQQRSMAKDTFPGAWDSSASGHLGAGEDYDSTALRELEEELGWQPAEALRRLFYLEACSETGWEFVWVYAVRGEGPFRMNVTELAGGAWFSPPEIDRLVSTQPTSFAASFIYLWPQARSRFTDAGS